MAKSVPRKIKVEIRDSPSGTRLSSLVTEGLDELLDYDLLWYGYLHCLKAPNLPNIKRSEAVVVSANEFRVTQVSISPGKTEEEVHIMRFTHDKARGCIVHTAYTLEGNAIYVATVQLHKRPLRVEAWVEQPSKAFPAVEAAPWVRTMLTDVLARMLPERSEPPGITMTMDVETPMVDTRTVLAEPRVHDLDFDQFVYQYLSILKCPTITKPTKSTTLEVHRENDEIVDFSVFHVLDGRALDAVGKGKGNGEDVILVQRHWYVRARQELSTEVIVPAVMILQRSLTKFYRSPLRLEHSVQQAGIRHPSEIMADVVKFIVERILNEKKTLLQMPWCSAAVREGESPGAPGLQSVVSEPLDTYLDLSSFWDLYLHMALSCTLPAHPVAGFEVLNASDSGFSIVQAGKEEEGPGSAPAAQPKNCIQYWTDREAKELRALFHGDKGQPLQWRSLKLHMEPARAEAWQEAVGTAVPGAQLLESAETFLHEVMGQVRCSQSSALRCTNYAEGGMEWVESGELPADVAFDDCWKACVDASFTGAWLGAVVRGAVQESQVLADTAVSRSVEHTVVAAEEEEVVVRARYWLCKSRCTILAETDKLKHHVMLRTEPLRVATWACTAGKRTAGSQLRSELQQVVDTIIGTMHPP